VLFVSEKAVTRTSNNAYSLNPVMGLIDVNLTEAENKHAWMCQKGGTISDGSTLSFEHYKTAYTISNKWVQYNSLQQNSTLPTQ
jgi:hypothetical protein